MVLAAVGKAERFRENDQRLAATLTDQPWWLPQLGRPADAEPRLRRPRDRAGPGGPEATGLGDALGG